MNTIVYSIFDGEDPEFVGLQAAEPNTIDLTDWHLTPSLITSLNPNPDYFVTAPITETGYFELQFHLGSNFWGCAMDFGNSECGRNIRQAFAHALDKVKFTSTQGSIAGLAVPIDSATPPSVSLTSPNPCAWDQLHPQTGPDCIVKSGSAAGGSAYHLAAASAGVGPAPGFSWSPGRGTADFCAAADHVVAALNSIPGNSVGKDATTCSLTGTFPSAAANGVNVFVRSDNPPRLEGGQSYAQVMCALFTGSFSTGCAPFVTVTPGPITAFPGFTTSPTAVEQDWNVYTGGFINVLTFDSSLFFGYHSQFVSGFGTMLQANGGPCSDDATPSFAANNYYYMCKQAYDTLITQAEFAPCLTAPGDPSVGQVTPTFTNCPATSQLTAKSAAYQAQDVFGQGAYTVPMWSSINKFGYRSEWQRVTLHKGNGLIPPGSLAANFNAWSPTPAVAGTIRQGYRQTTTSVDVYTSNTAWDAGITGNIWDGPNTINPDSPQTLLEWMTISTVSLTNAQLTYTPAPGTVATYRYTLRNDIFWHTGQKVTAWDLAFSDISYKATGTPPGGGLAPMVGIKVLSSTQVDLNVDAVGPFTQLFLSATVIPGRFWSSCGAAAWDAGASLSSFAAANAALTPCIGPDVTASGVILPSNTAVDIAKIQPVYDPIQNGIFVGSGSWVCKGTPFGAGAPVIGAACVSTVSSTNPNGVQNPPPGGSYTLQRNGLGFAPGASVTGSYFRSAGALALWIWSGNTGDFTSDFLNFGVVALCFGQALQALGNTSGCGHWQQGIGAPGGHAVVGLTQVGIVLRFVGVNWVAPFNWLNNPPQGIGSFPPVLYEGSATLNPVSVAGCAVAYPLGGYNC